MPKAAQSGTAPTTQVASAPARPLVPALRRRQRHRELERFAPSQSHQAADESGSPFRALSPPSPGQASSPLRAFSVPPHTPDLAPRWGRGCRPLLPGERDVPEAWVRACQHSGEQLVTARGGSVWRKEEKERTPVSGLLSSPCLKAGAKRQRKGRDKSSTAGCRLA